MLQDLSGTASRANRPPRPGEQALNDGRGLGRPRGGEPQQWQRRGAATRSAADRLEPSEGRPLHKTLPT
eukprot:15474239-Alexandrium_andersonii.AAC.1